MSACNTARHRTDFTLAGYPYTLRRGGAGSQSRGLAWSPISPNLWRPALWGRCRYVGHRVVFPSGKFPSTKPYSIWTAEAVAEATATAQHYTNPL